MHTYTFMYVHLSFEGPLRKFHSRGIPQVQSNLKLVLGFCLCCICSQKPTTELGFPCIGIQAYTSAINSQCRTHFAALFRYISERRRDALACSTYESQSRLNEISHNSQLKTLLKLAGVEKAAFAVNVGRAFCTHLHTLSLSLPLSVLLQCERRVASLSFRAKLFI